MNPSSHPFLGDASVADPAVFGPERADDPAGVAEAEHEVAVVPLLTLPLVAVRDLLYRSAWRQKIFRFQNINFRIHQIFAKCDLIYETGQLRATERHRR